MLIFFVCLELPKLPANEGIYLLIAAFFDLFDLTSFIINIQENKF